jgi:uncharacterized protein YbjT (DUF2867 family)
MANNDKIILVTGATGHQGGAVARHLLATGWRVRALTRDPNKPAAQVLAQMGAEVVRGDFEDRASLDRAIQGVYGVFSVQTPLATWGTEGETRQGQALADAAASADVQHFVYSSVGGAERNTGIPHFESKWRIEQHIQQLGLPATIIRPVFFMDNFNTFLRPQQHDGQEVIAVTLPPDKHLQMIAADDIGAFVALAFAKPAAYLGIAIELAGDELTMPRAVETYARVAKRNIQYVELPIEQIRSFSEDSARMFEWLQESGYAADIPALRKLYPPLKTFETWLRETSE